MKTDQEDAGAVGSHARGQRTLSRRRFFRLGAAGVFASINTPGLRAADSRTFLDAMKTAEKTSVASVEDDFVRVVAFHVANSIALLSCIKRQDGSWRSALASGASPAVYMDDTVIEERWYPEYPTIEWRDGSHIAEGTPVFKRAELRDRRTLVLNGLAVGLPIEQHVKLLGRGHLRIFVRGDIGVGEIGIGTFMTHFHLVPDGRAEGYALPLDLAWLPVLHWTEHDVASDYFFRSPAAIAMSRNVFASVVPDLSLLKADRPIPQALDLRVTGTETGAPRISYGLCTSEVVPHTFARHRQDVTMQLTGDQLQYGCDLFLGEAESAGDVMIQTSSYLWSAYGHQCWNDIRPQVLPFEEYGRRYAYVNELKRWARPVETAAGKAFGLDNPNRAGANFHAWENDLHVAYGIAYYGRKWQDAELVSIAAGIVRLVRSAPRNHGAFPTLFNFASGSWEGSVIGAADQIDATRGYDASAMGVTCWWLLNVYDHLDADFGLADIAFSYAEFLASKQLESGAIPAFFNPDLTPAPQLEESGTTALSGALLARAARLGESDRLHAAAVKAGDFVQRELVPGLRLQDFENFQSCSPTPILWRDPWSGIWPQNTLSLSWSADQCLALFHLTADQHWLRMGEHLLSNLSLYQQVWSPPYQKGCYLFGGFGVMNTDGEWSDGRQARFVSTYAEYFFATGKLEYLERAVSAARAGFALMDIAENHLNGINDRSVSPEGLIAKEQDRGKGYAPENAFHLGPVFQTHWTGFDWSAGGALAAAAYLEAHYGAVWVDGRTLTATPIDGVSARIESWLGNQILLKIDNALAGLKQPFTSKRTILVKFGFLKEPVLQVTINECSFGMKNKEELYSGLRVAV